MAVWRELRRAGAVPVSAGTWTLPDLPGFAPGIAAVRAAASRGGGTVAVFTATPHDGSDSGVLADAFTTVRRDEWAEFIADCGKFDAEIEREIAKHKLTFAELEEEEQSLDRLRRWHRDLAKRNAVPLPDAAAATVALDASSGNLARYAEMVYAANLTASPAESEA